MPTLTGIHTGQRILKQRERFRRLLPVLGYACQPANHLPEDGSEVPILCSVGGAGSQAPPPACSSPAKHGSVLPLWATGLGGGVALKRAILDAMGLRDLQRATSRLGIHDNVDRRSPRSMHRRLDKEQRATVALLIEVLRKARIQEIAESLGIDSSGRKEELIQQILSTSSSVSRPRRSTASLGVVRKPPAGILHSVHRLGDVKALNIQAIRGDAKGCHYATIISAYYSVKTLQNIARDCPARILLHGVQGPRGTRQVQELQNLKRRRKKVEIRLIFCGSLFHTKLYLFKRKKSVVAWIGSANATESALGSHKHNEEILLRMNPSPDYLLNYAEKAWDEGVPIEDVPPSPNSDKINTLSLFFSDGALYYKPFFVLQVTVNPFYRLMDVLENDEKRRLVAFDPPDAEPTAGVGPFSIVRAFQRIEKVKEPQNRVTIRHLGIESCYGLWIASRYIQEVDQRVDKAAGEKVEFYNSLLDWLKSEHGQRRLREAFCRYLASVRSTLDEANVNWRIAIERHSIADPFESMGALENRVELLTKSLSRDSRRITRSFVRVDVPSFDEDEQSRDEFHLTLMESLAGSLRAPNLSRAARWVLEGVADVGKGEEQEPDEIRRKLELRLRRKRS